MQVAVAPAVPLKRHHHQHDRQGQGDSQRQTDKDAMALATDDEANQGQGEHQRRLPRQKAQQVDRHQGHARRLKMADLSDALHEGLQTESAAEPFGVVVLVPISRLQ